jgi:hypothetical protein
MTEATKRATKSASASDGPAEQAKDAAAKKPSRDDVHEQREAGQKHEGVVTPPARPPTQTQIELDRAAGEGMAAPSSDPNLTPTKRSGAAPAAGRQG